MIVKLKCNKCKTEFKIEFVNKSADGSYYTTCPNCGNSGYELDEIERVEDVE